MTNAFSRIGWPAFAGVGMMLLLGVLAFYLSGTMRSSRGQPKLPPIPALNVQPGFVGEMSIGAWKLVCQNLQAAAAEGQAPSPKRLCRANARVTVKGKDAQPVLAAGFNVLMIDTVDHPAIMFRLPIGARVAPTIGFAIDKNTVFQAPLRCSEKECVAQGALPAEALEQMKSGKTLMLVYTVRDAQMKDHKVRVDQMLYGFPEAFAAMTTAMAS
jgi:invasion protein IalB